jgi:hypothetical protein
MENNDFRNFQKFNDEALLIEATEVLKTNNIDFEVENNAASFDPSFSYSQVFPEFILKLVAKDFEKAHQLLDEATKESVKLVEKDYYLFNFTDEELFEVLSKPDEWSRFDFLLAQQIMKDRGNEISHQTLQLLKNQRISDLKQTTTSYKAWIWAGYFLAITGGLLGIFIALNLINSKKTLPNGEQIYLYSKDDRQQGWIILIIGLSVFFVITILYYFQALKEL